MNVETMPMNDSIFNTGETQQELREKYNPDGSVRRAVQLRLLDMLLYLDTVCKEIGVPYRLDGGNVLGALRHGGFIPWDDDVDVVVEKQYYEKLCNYLTQHPHPRYKIQSYRTDKGCLRFWNTLRDVNSRYIHKQSNVLENAFEYQGLQIDLFCYVPGIIPSLHTVSGAFYRKAVFPLIGRSPLLARCLFWIQRYFINPVFSLISSVFGDKNFFMHCYGTSFPYRFHKDVLEPYSPIIFEGYEFPGPHDPELFCEIVYGNWKDLPDIDKRNHHDVDYVLFD